MAIRLDFIGGMMIFLIAMLAVVVGGGLWG